MHHSILFAALLAACSTAPAKPAPAKPAPAPVVVKPVAKPSLQRLVAGGWPGSNTHQWGTRFYELRIVPAGASGTQQELRLHDEIDFQGVGMQPHQMPPTNHACSPWEPLPEAIRISPSITSCDSAKAECAAIDAHLRATARGNLGDDTGALAMPDFMFGRGRTTCD